MADKDKPKPPVYQSADGRGYHNAHGQEVTEDGEVIEAAAPEPIDKEEVKKEDEAWRADMEAQAGESATPRKSRRKK